MLKIHKAKKNYRCNECGRLIPVGTKYWRDYEATIEFGCIKNDKEHTNCLDFEDQPKVESTDLRKMNALRKQKQDPKRIS